MSVNLALIAGTALIGLLGFLASIFKSVQDQHTGAALQTGADATAALKAETAIANSEAQTPDVADRLTKGTF